MCDSISLSIVYVFHIRFHFVLDCLCLCRETEKPKLWEFIKKNNVLITPTRQEGDAHAITRILWTPPPIRFIKMNSDGSFSRLYKQAAGGVVFWEYFRPSAEVLQY